MRGRNEFTVGLSREIVSQLKSSHEFPLPIVMLLAGFALGNMTYGLRIAVRLMRKPTPEPDR
jgi:hypothetical protein